MLCDASLTGKELTPEAIKAYYQSRAALQGDITTLLLDDLPALKIPGKKKFSLAAMGFGVSAALNFIRRKPDESGPSASLARSKRRGKLLDNLETGDVAMGSMSDVDALLRRPEND